MEDSDEPIINIKIVSVKEPVLVGDEDVPVQLFTPGEVVTTETGIMRGHGTYEENNVSRACVAGIEKRVGKLILVKPLRCRYAGEIGDVVVGRIVEVQQKRWKVDVRSRLDAVLLLSSVNLPGGELRRRSAEDEQMMRKYLMEGDLISAEVQNIFSEGALSLHTRSLRYGKLSQGILVTIPADLVKRCKTHFHNICGISIILGTNGNIWLYPTPPSTEDGAGGFAKNIEMTVSKEEREALVRVRACILALSNSNMLVYDTSIIAAYDTALKYKTTELVYSETLLDIALCTRSTLLCPEGT